MTWCTGSSETPTCSPSRKLSLNSVLGELEERPPEPVIDSGLKPSKTRDESDLPEILRGDLSSILTLAHWGERDITAFLWLTAFTPLTPSNMLSAYLQQLKAMDSKGGITELGR